MAEYLTLGVGISSTYAASNRHGRVHLSLSSLLCLTVHFSARIFDLERYESRRSEGRKREKRGVALIHSTVSASLPPLSALPRGDVLAAPSPLQEVCQNIPCFFVSNISLVVISSSRVRRRLEAMLAFYSHKTVARSVKPLCLDCGCIKIPSIVERNLSYESRPCPA